MRKSPGEKFAPIDEDKNSNDSPKGEKTGAHI